MKNDTIISLAEVSDRADPSRNGTFTAKVNAEGSEERPIYYTSPYGSNMEGAFIAIPEVGTEVLVCKPHGSDKYYYMGTSFSSEPTEAAGQFLKQSLLNPIERSEVNMYKARGVPMRYLFKSPNGAGITMSEEYTPEYINKKTEITSTLNKKIQLHDAPTIDSIILDSGNGSRITLTDDPKADSLPSRAVQVETVGPQKYLNTGSQTDIYVGDAGRELQMLNNANGVRWGTIIPAGNVNVQSKWKDVNVFTQAEQGRIFIECLNEDGSNQEIVIETNGENGNIVVKTKGTITLAADQTIQMKAPNVNVDCQSYSVKADKVDVQCTGQVDIDGSLINLANGANAPAVNPPNPQSRYGNTGVTTY